MTAKKTNKKLRQGKRMAGVKLLTNIVDISISKNVDKAS